MRTSYRRLSSLLLFALASSVSVLHPNHGAAANAAETASDETHELVAIASVSIDLKPSDVEHDSSATAYVYDGEDAGIGAFRFAETYASFYNDLTMPVPTVMEVAHKLNDALTSSNYTPPDELTKCGKRACSAGKLWKLSDEMRKAELHDAAGAALIRALLKNGIEVDFVERCHRSLNWALGSIRRQRERELKEAEEEAKDEKRREQERVAMAEAATRREEYEADFVRFGEGVAKFLAEVEAGEATISAASIGPDGSVETDAEAQQIIFKAKQTFVANGPQGGNHEETLQLIKKLSPSDKTVDILLIEARCHEHNANYKAVISAAGKVIQKAATHEPWVNGTPRMMAATFGANAAMQLGLSTNALSFYQNVLKFDPEQDRARKQYRGLKKVVKLMDKAEEQIQKGYNKKASEIVEDCLVAMRGLDVDSPLFRTKIQLKQCAILSGMQKHEEALEYCDAALDVRLNDESVMAESRKEAHLVRAEALLLDMDYDEAVNDFRAAFDLVPEEKENLEDKRELQHKLQQAMHQQELWNGGKKDFQFNEKTGYPDGRPPQRDHAKILLLPIDLEEREKEIKCAWLKKQFKMLVKKYHPDKYKGNIKRGSRKFKEVKEAKEILSNAWGC